MCGIAGIVALCPVNRLAVQAMTDLMVHRGPDGEGQWLSADGLVCFGHRRLSIIDLNDRAAQPMQDPAGRLTLTYNGEIYNYRELRAELAESGVPFLTESDTEVVMEAYRKWGDACVDRFNGMFAFALHDSYNKRIFCARDRFGEKPFLFSAGSGFFAFASDFKALCALEGVEIEPDETLVARFLISPSNGFDQSRQTAFRSIQQLLPGQKLVLDTADLSYEISPYWQPPVGAAQKEISEVDALATFRDLLQDAVRIRLRSDVPVGSCLSGGLDSSAIACIARRLSGDKSSYQVFTGRFPDDDSDEGIWAGIAASAANAKMHEAFPTGEKLVETLDEFLLLNELPVDSTSQFAQWCVFEAAKNAGVTVLLDGQGSDEILAGYEQYFAEYIKSRRSQGNYDADEEKKIRDRYPLAFSEQDQGWKKTIPPGLKKLLSRGLSRGTSVTLALHPDLASKIRKTSPSAPDGLHATLRGDYFNGYLTALLRYGDRNSMAHSREVRLPFCDHRIAEFVASLPVEMLMGHAQTKYLLRQSMRHILPEEILKRWNKQGFLPPIAQWLRGDLGEIAKDLMSTAAFDHSLRWDAAWCRAAWKRFESGDNALAPTIWKILTSELWYDHFVDGLRRSDRVSPTV